MTASILAAAPFAAFAFATAISPGPANLMLMTSAANFGAARTLAFAVGLFVGFQTQLVVTGLGAAGLITARPQIAVALEWIGTAYLIWLAVGMWNTPAGGAESKAVRRPDLMAGVLLNWVNPKAWTMATGAVALNATATHPLLLTCVVFFLVGLISVATWIAVGARLAPLFRDLRTGRWINRGLAGLLAAAAGVTLLL